MSSYDPQVRRDTPLAVKLKELIRRDGPITVAQYMEMCLYDPEHGYYRKQPAIGAAGDFVTAPEISQVFGELIGLWSVVVWQQMGAPARFNLVELGPGRGTLMADALRAARVVPAFADAARITLVETNEVLAAAQREAMAPFGGSITWMESLTAAANENATILIGNEFIDTIPVAQHVLREGSWVERTVELDGLGQLAFGLSKQKGMPDQARFNASAGDILEGRKLTPLLLAMEVMATHAPFAALLIDYGHTVNSTGDTLQAVRGHAFEHPLTSPGEADLTSQVDFAELGERAEALGLVLDGVVTQSELLGALGIMERASRLMAVNPHRAGEIEAGVARLMSPTGMGSRFKAIGLRTPGMPVLPGFPRQRTR